MIFTDFGSNSKIDIKEVNRYANDNQIDRCVFSYIKWLLRTMEVFPKFDINRIYVYQFDNLIDLFVVSYINWLLRTMEVFPGFDIKIIYVYAFDILIYWHWSNDISLCSQSRLSWNIKFGLYAVEANFDTHMYILWYHIYHRYQK